MGGWMGGRVVDEWVGWNGGWVAGLERWMDGWMGG